MPQHELTEERFDAAVAEIKKNEEQHGSYQVMPRAILLVASVLWAILVELRQWRQEWMVRGTLGL